MLRVSNTFCRSAGRQLRRNLSKCCFQSVILDRIQVSSGRSFSSITEQQQQRFQSSVAVDIHNDSEFLDETTINEAAHATEIKRLRQIRHVGVFAHVDAGKTTVTERMLALAGVVHQAGNVDDGNTVTDYLPAERERGITIQSAAISFDWAWHNAKRGNDLHATDNVTIALIDTPGHIDFSVEVSRSVAVLDGAVLVVDAVCGVQAQTETVWRAMTRPTLNNHESSEFRSIMADKQEHAHEPLPCLAVINKMDKEGSSFGYAIKTLRDKLPGAKPLPIQIPLFQVHTKEVNSSLFHNLVAINAGNMSSPEGNFVGVVDLIHMRAIVWPDGSSSAVEECIPKVTSLLQANSLTPLDENCQITQQALIARAELIESLAESDERMEEYYLTGEEPSNAEIRLAIRRLTLAHSVLPVMASAAVRGKGVEPILDAIADLLPSPLDRQAPALIVLDQKKGTVHRHQAARSDNIRLGHPLHPSALALVFKVLHMKGRGGSGDGRVVFARVYSGELRDRDVVNVMTPPALGEPPSAFRTERIGGMLELAGGKFSNLEDGVCRSGGVCALVGLKSVVTGDTIVMQPTQKEKKKGITFEPICLAGVSSPKPVLTVRLEAESTAQQTKLTEALNLLTVEDPSLFVEESQSATLLSGLGELHIEITLDRLKREYGLGVMVGKPAVKYRETCTRTIESGLCNYDRTFGGTRLQAAVHIQLKPTGVNVAQDSPCMVLADPIVSIGEQARAFLDIDPGQQEEDLMVKSELYRALVQGCQGALQRGPFGSYALTNLKCTVINIDADDGLPQLLSQPGALRAAAANAVSTALADHKHDCCVLEPTMGVEISLPNDMVGNVLSDLTGRRGSVDSVLVGDECGQHSKALIRCEVPLVEILGYANALRSLTAGEGMFTAEYKGHTIAQTD
jgi:elongation factor G